jgi:dolichol-phosphate mannosyltransferase
LNELAQTNSRLIVHDKPNSGHGPTILKGYKENSDATWIFQTDSDNELPASHFHVLWENRDDYAFLLGLRDGRLQPLPRKLISMISRFVIQMFYKKAVTDVNSPYRLMKSVKLKDVFESIPEDTFAPNVIISGMVGVKNLKLFETLVPHQNRTTGEVSIKKWRLFKAACRSLFQTIMYTYSR